MTSDFVVKAVRLDGLSWPLRPLLQSLDSPEMGEGEWWRRMATLTNAAARAGDTMLLEALDQKRASRFGTPFDAPEVVSPNNLPPLSMEENIKRWFQKLDKDKQQEFLKKAMEQLLNAADSNGSKIFTKKQHWMAVYMVLRDRLGTIIMRNDFHTYAAEITPGTCPPKLMISSSTMTNFSKTVPEGSYFKMKNNPFHDQCSTLWTIIKNLYFSGEFTNE